MTDLWDCWHRVRGLPGLHWKGEMSTVALSHWQCPHSAPEAKGGKQWPWMFPPRLGTYWALPQSQRQMIKHVPTAPEPTSANIYGSLIWCYLLGNFLFLERKKKKRKENHAYKSRHCLCPYQQELIILNILIYWFPTLSVFILFKNYADNILILICFNLCSSHSYRTSSWVQFWGANVLPTEMPLSMMAAKRIILLFYLFFLLAPQMQTYFFFWSLTSQCRKCVKCRKTKINKPSVVENHSWCLFWYTSF